MTSNPKAQASGGWKGARGRRETWAEFDALPVAVKRLYWAAPYKYTAYGAVQHVARGGSLRAVIVRQIDAIARDVAREVTRIYGRSHPQARSGQWL